MIPHRLIRWVERHPMVGNVVLGVVAALVVIAVIRLATGK